MRLTILLALSALVFVAAVHFEGSAVRLRREHMSMAKTPVSVFSDHWYRDEEGTICPRSATAATTSPSTRTTQAAYESRPAGGRR
jgi:hypothetical protein